MLAKRESVNVFLKRICNKKKEKSKNFVFQVFSTEIKSLAFVSRKRDELAFFGYLPISNDKSRINRTERQEINCCVKQSPNPDRAN